MPNSCAFSELKTVYTITRLPPSLLIIAVHWLLTGCWSSFALDVSLFRTERASSPENGCSLWSQAWWEVYVTVTVRDILVCTCVMLDKQYNGGSYVIWKALKGKPSAHCACLAWIARHVHSCNTLTCSYNNTPYFQKGKPGSVGAVWCCSHGVQDELLHEWPSFPPPCSTHTFTFE